MVAQQRLAVFRLSIVFLVLALFALMAPIVGPTRAQGALGLLALTAVEPLVFRRKRAGPWDERDKALFLHSLQISGVILALLATAALWITYYLHQNTGTVPVELIPLAAWSIWIGFSLIHSVTILLLYLRG